MADVRGSRYSEKSLRFALRACQFTFRRLQLFQSLHALLKVSLSRRGCAQLSRRALQQHNAEPLFQSRHFGAHGRIGHAEKLRRLAEAAGFNDFDENLDAVEIHAGDSTLDGTMFPRFAV